MKEKNRYIIQHFKFIVFISILFVGCHKDEIKDYTGQTGTIKDVDGNIYPTIGIGSQIWMAENLKTTKYNDGTAIPLIIDEKEWEGLITPACCLYKYNPDVYKTTYGILYNSFVVSKGNLCPMGWHVPTDEEWTVLTNFLGGEDVAGGKLKEEGTVHWESFPGLVATNESKFTALGSGGYIFSTTLNMWEFYPINQGCFLWSCTVYYNNDLWGRALYFDNNRISGYIFGESFGCSVRCVKDN
jgi:uncharacterized protein (TIGR02145 family)